MDRAKMYLSSTSAGSQKHFKIYRDSSSLSGEDSSLGDSGFTSAGHLTLNSTDARQSTSASLATIEEYAEIREEIMTPPNVDRPPAGPSTVTPKILALALTTPVKVPPHKEAEERMEVAAMTPMKIQEPRTPTRGAPPEPLNSTPKKAKLTSGRKRSMRDKLFSESGVKRVRSENMGPPARMDLSPIAKNSRVLRERSASENNLMRSSTPKQASLVPEFEAAGEGGQLRRSGRVMKRFCSFSPSKLQRRCVQRFDMEQTGMETLGNIQEEMERPPLQRQDAVRDAQHEVSALSIEEFNISSESFDDGFSKGLGSLLHAPMLEVSMRERSPEPLIIAEEPTAKTPPKQPSPPSRERNSILHPTLPKTPLKKTPKRLQRRPSSAKKSPHKSYVGLERLDIVARLKGLKNQPKPPFLKGQATDRDRHFDLHYIVEAILQQLSDTDLFHAGQVSSNWLRIIEEYPQLAERRRQHIRRLESEKENAQRSEKKLLDESVERKAFSSANFIYNYSREESKEEVSPNTSPFKENQKIVTKFSPQAMTTCPRCARPSPIVTIKIQNGVPNFGRVTRSNKKKSAELRRLFSESAAAAAATRKYSAASPAPSPDSGSESSTGSEPRFRRNLFAARKAQSLDAKTGVTLRRTYPAVEWADDYEYEYAVCGGRSCGFQFCVQCSCEFHPGRRCQGTLAAYSPGREAPSPHNVVCSKQSRRTLKRLCA